jgi:hypothetical protein
MYVYTVFMCTNLPIGLSSEKETVREKAQSCGEGNFDEMNPAQFRPLEVQRTTNWFKFKRIMESKIA